MRIYANTYELMSETGRNLWEMGNLVKPHSMQNKVVEGDDNYHTKELICEQYCLTDIPDEDYLFTFDQRSKEWTKAELFERIQEVFNNPGKAYKIRRDLWEPLLNGEGKFDYTYHERFHHGILPNNKPNIVTIVKELESNPDSRQCVLPIFSLDDVQYIGGKRRVPCSMYYDFLIRENASGEKQLNICYHQRSSDFVTHFGNDVWLAWKTMQHIATYLGVKPGYLYHTIDSLHSYKKDWPLLKTSLQDLKEKNL